MPKPPTCIIPAVRASGLTGALVVALATHLAVLAPVAAAAADPGADGPTPVSNGLTNGGAEDGDTGPAGWRSGGYKPQDAIFTWDATIRHAGARSLAIGTGTVANDVRWTQSVTVPAPPAGSPDHRYLASGWIKTEGVNGGYGASLGNESTFDRTAGISGTTDWTYVSTELRVRAGSQLHIAARLGYFTTLSTGRAWFDDMQLVDLDAAPTRPAPAPVPAPAAAPALTSGQPAWNGHFATTGGRVSAVRHHIYRPRYGPLSIPRCARSSHSWWRGPRSR